jgi:GNAT superfamily N-acetyltransferase
MTTQTDFRPIQSPTDVSGIERVTRDSGFFSEEEVAIAQELAQAALTQGDASGYLVLVALQANRVIGFSCFGPIPATLGSYDVYWIVVDPSLQRQGIGKALLAQSESIAKQHGARRMYIDTASREQYVPTHRFYERAGYERAAFLPDFYSPGDGKLIFARALA